MAPAPPLDRRELAAQEYFNQPAGFPFEGFELSQVLLPPGENFGINSDDDDEEEDVIDAETGFGSAIVIDGLPVVTSEKFDKLKGVIMKHCTPFGHVRNGCFWMPVDESGKTKGYCFVEYSTREEASLAIQKLQNLKLDKNHTFAVNSVDDLDRLSTVPDVYTQPEAKPFEAQDDIMSWLLDKRGRDQFLIQYASETEVCWNDAKKGHAELAFARSFWTEGPLKWSPHGTYVATLHRQGAVLWASKADSTFVKVSRFACPGVEMVNFSAHEEYISCYSVIPPPNNREQPQIVMSVFDCRSGRKLRQMTESLDSLLVGSWACNAQRLRKPFFAWSPAQPAMCAKLTHDAIQVYYGADMTLLDNQSFRLESVQDMQWSPVDNIMCTYQSEVGNMPARMSLISFPDKTELRQKNLFTVSAACIFWHPQGKYLAVQVSKLTKTKKTTYTSFELFKVNEKGIPNDVLELPNKSEKVNSFAWEPKGDRFAIVHGDGPRVNVSFYSMLDKSLKDGAKHLGTITNRAVSELHWSPAGKNIVLAGLTTNTGQLEFFNVDDMNSHRSQQHFMCTDVAWDFTGRYVCTYVDVSRDMEHGYIIWSFTGDMLYRSRQDSFLNFSWRPRPPSQLPPEKEREVAKNLKTYAKRFEEQDEILLQAADVATTQRRARQRQEWEAFLQSKQAWFAEQKEYLASVLGYVPQPLPYKTQLKEVQQVFDVREEPFNG